MTERQLQLVSAVQTPPVPEPSALAAGKSKRKADSNKHVSPMVNNFKPIVLRFKKASSPADYPRLALSADFSIRFVLAFQYIQHCCIQFLIAVKYSAIATLCPGFLVLERIGLIAQRTCAVGF